MIIYSGGYTYQKIKRQAKSGYFCYYNHISKDIFFINDKANDLRIPLNWYLAVVKEVSVNESI